MKINEETTVSEEQVLFNKLNLENQQMILRIMRCLQPCELSCEVEEEKEIPEKINEDIDYINFNIKLFPTTSSTKFNYKEKVIINKINEIIDYLKSKGE